MNSILFVAALVMTFILLSMLGVHEQEAGQLLSAAAIVHYAITYCALFALPVFGFREFRARLPGWLKVVAAAGLAASLISLFISVVPIVAVVSRASYAAKICALVVISNLAGVLIYRAGAGRPGGGRQAGC